MALNTGGWAYLRERVWSLQPSWGWEPRHAQVAWDPIHGHGILVEKTAFAAPRVALEKTL